MASDKITKDSPLVAELQALLAESKYYFDFSLVSTKTYLYRISIDFHAYSRTIKLYHRLKLVRYFGKFEAFRSQSTKNNNSFTMY